MTDERLRLKWNDFRDIVQASFAELRTDTDFTDVTLACEDQSIKAHKVVLSACSPFFKKLLKMNPHPLPLIYMRGLKSSNLTAIVDFIYLGEANVFQDQLGSFLALAEELQLEGLDGSSEEKAPEFPRESFSLTERRADIDETQSIPAKKLSNVNYKADTFEGTVMTISSKTEYKISYQTQYNFRN